MIDLLLTRRKMDFEKDFENGFEFRDGLDLNEGEAGLSHTFWKDDYEVE